jgi:hypothetical protein
MELKNPIWLLPHDPDAGKPGVVGVDGGASIPAVAGNADWDALVESGVEIAAYEAPAKDYTELRAAAYAKLTEQLDMQYHDAANGTTTWVDHVAEVKAAHPK